MPSVCAYVIPLLSRSLSVISGEFWDQGRFARALNLQHGHGPRLLPFCVFGWRLEAVISPSPSKIAIRPQGARRRDGRNELVWTGTLALVDRCLPCHCSSLLQERYILILTIVSYKSRRPHDLPWLCPTPLPRPHSQVPSPISPLPPSS